MTTKTVPSYKAYFIIWGWLIVLLAAGTFFSTLPLSKQEVASLILAVSVTKAALVALFYMHLKFERPVPIWIVAVFPFFLIGLAVLLVFIGVSLG